MSTGTDTTQNDELAQARPRLMQALKAGDEETVDRILKLLLARDGEKRFNFIMTDVCKRHPATVSQFKNRAAKRIETWFDKNCLDL
jgi:DNA gyrase/topoisomerase IV subunit B